MTASVDVAWGEICARVKAEWDADALTLPIPLLWDNVVGEPPESKDANGHPQPWARVTVNHAVGGDAALGGRLFFRAGSVFVQVFTPLGANPKLAKQVAEVALRAFDGKRTASGVWFRSARLNEVGPSGNWYQSNVVADFTYDQLR